MGASHPHKQQATAKIKTLLFAFFWLEVVPLLNLWREKALVAAIFFLPAEGRAPSVEGMVSVMEPPAPACLPEAIQPTSAPSRCRKGHHPMAVAEVSTSPSTLPAVHGGAPPPPLHSGEAATPTTNVDDDAQDYAQ